MKEFSTPLLVKLRPLLTCGVIARVAEGRTTIFIDSEQSPQEQNITLFHEMFHAVGIRDEAVVEALAHKCASAAPDALQLVLRYARESTPNDPARGGCGGSRGVSKR